MAPDWLVAAVIVLPIVASTAPFLLGLRYPDVGPAVSILSLLATFGLATPIVATAARGEVVRYEVGGVPAAYGIELVADAIAATMVLLTVLVVLGAAIHTRRVGPHGTAFHSGLLLLAGGTIGIALTGDLFNLYVFLEIAAIASYALVASADSRVSTYASFKYLLVGTIGASLYLLGVAYVFVATGTLNMRSVADAFAAMGYGDPLVVTSFALIAVGLAVKIALVPLHTWLADAHAAAPDAVSAIVSGLLPAVAVYALARVTFGVYTVDFVHAHPLLTSLLLYGGLVTVFAGGVFAVFQSRIKLLLAYSTVAHMGLAVVGVALATDEALYGALLQLVGHGIVKAALFLLAGLFAVAYGARTLDGYAGLASRSPGLAIVFTVLGLSLVGVPPTSGFVAKYYIVVGAIDAGQWLVAGLVVASTLVTVAYVFPIIDRLYFRDYDGPVPDRAAIPAESTVVVAVALVLTVVIGLVTVPLGGFLAPAIEVMLS